MKNKLKELSEKFKSLGKGTKIIIALLIILIIIAIPTTIHCFKYDVTPIEMIEDVVTPSDEKIVGKWQGEANVTGYEFDEEGTYKNYFGAPDMPSEGRYMVEGNKITLTNNNHTGSVVYKFSVNGNTLTMETYSENGIKVDDPKEFIYSKVDEIKIKSPLEAIQDELNKKANENASANNE